MIRAGCKFTHKETGRVMSITGCYEGHGPDDPSGYYYVFDDAECPAFWISTSALAVRFR